MSERGAWIGGISTVVAAIAAVCCTFGLSQLTGGEPETTKTTEVISDPGSEVTASLDDVPSYDAPAEPTLRAEPDVVANYGTITLIGEGFEPGEQVRIEWVDYIPEGALRDTTADEQGRINAEVRVGDMSFYFMEDTSYSIKATGLSSDKTGTTVIHFTG